MLAMMTLYIRAIIRCSTWGPAFVFIMVPIAHLARKVDTLCAYHNRYIHALSRVLNTKLNFEIKFTLPASLHLAECQLPPRNKVGGHCGDFSGEAFRLVI